ncbi:TIR-only protein-like [Eucalyptus grandis]|uniref:TIR-only protein-like n=1 Tax=Eucalyptus grandis TaxID=71139 RepID=UPI00192EFDC1|nr:TIR-only protein-like [Eucalyptus grandis]
MANSETGTRTNILSGGEYQVFLNFRGCDIRRGFADTLYHFLDSAQIRIFMDDAEIGAGEIIGDKLMQAINDSKLYIPIFSPRYASSHWCLIELARMMENISISKEDENKKVILPIFYDVEPEELKLKPEEHNLQRPSYHDAILNLEEKKVNQEKKFSTEDVDRWRKALREVDGSKGFKLKDHLG